VVTSAALVRVPKQSRDHSPQLARALVVAKHTFPHRTDSLLDAVTRPVLCDAGQGAGTQHARILKSILEESATAPTPDELRGKALAALEAGSIEEAHVCIRQALAASTDLEGINDLAVIAHRLGRGDEAKTLLRAALAIDPARADAAANLAALEQLEPPAGWRRSGTLGGSDPTMNERAFPGMLRPDIISERCSRYAFALSLVGGAHALDLGCGTGYGSEMLSWSAASVRGFDLWRPGQHEHPRWPGVAELNYGHDLCADPLPPADVAVMFEVIEHLPDAPRALEIAWRSVEAIIGSFPNPAHNSSRMNQNHVNDWPLERFERELERAAVAAGRGATELTHYHQAVGSPLLTEGRDPEASYWVVVARVSRNPERLPTNTSGIGSNEPGEPAYKNPSGAVTLDASATVTVESAVAPAVSITPDMPIRDYWHARARQHTSDSYLGIKMSKFPEDLRVYEQLLFIAEPGVVIELGAQFGGSTLWLRDRLRTLAGYRGDASPTLVISVDIDLSAARRNVAARDPGWADTIVFVEGDVRDPAVRAEVGRHVPPSARCLVIEDSAHVESTTVAALELYSDLVPVGGFFVVEDGCVDVEWMRTFENWPRGVLPGLTSWLATSQGSCFSVRPDLEVYGISCHPSGFLQRVA
jgi:cephalosporin hydroxylase